MHLFISFIYLSQIILLLKLLVYDLHIQTGLMHFRQVNDFKSAEGEELQLRSKFSTMSTFSFSWSGLASQWTYVYQLEFFQAMEEKQPLFCVLPWIFQILGQQCKSQAHAQLQGHSVRHDAKRTTSSRWGLAEHKPSIYRVGKWGAR